MFNRWNTLHVWLFVATLHVQIDTVQSWSTIKSALQPQSCQPHSKTRIISRRNHCHVLNSQANNNNNNDLAVSQFPPPLVWLWSPSSQDQDEWLAIQDISTIPAAIQTWNWARHFVLRLNLCPWARASLETPRAMQVFVVPKDQEIRYTTGNYANEICFGVAQKCLDYLEEYPEMESQIIFFVVFQEEDVDADCEDNMDNPFHGFYDQWENFIDFHEWFMDLEDGWDMDEIIVAPFHPQWQFGGDGASKLDFEKKSPYPTVTFVSTKVVEQAGEAATAQIAKKNEVTLEAKSLEDLKGTWKDSSSSEPSMPW